jgi:hypothetical protein
VNGPSPAHGLLVDERLTEQPVETFCGQWLLRKRADALPHRPREAKRDRNAASLPSASANAPGPENTWQQRVVPMQQENERKPSPKPEITNPGAPSGSDPRAGSREAYTKGGMIPRFHCGVCR